MVYLLFEPTKSVRMKSEISNSSVETQNIAQDFGKTLKGGSVVCLYGELGAGKTTFVQGLARGLGIKNRIISPSFIIVRRYDLGLRNKDLKIKHFYHIDLYRLENENGLEGLGLDEILDDKKSIIAVEWAEKLGKKLPKKRTDIYLESIDDDERQIVWK